VATHNSRARAAAPGQGAITIGQLAQRFRLSRSTLLYYDSIGLLCPSRRSPSNYRLYTDEDVRRMEAIDLYRQAGLSLTQIATLLSARGSGLDAVLRERLDRLNREIHALREQQRLILRLLRADMPDRGARSLDKRGWVAILEAAGLGPQERRRWHVEFERLSPEAHRDFLESLGLDADEVSRIRDWAARRAGQRRA
jgi:DNA-binding transcriptional MerR regulator